MSEQDTREQLEADVHQYANPSGYKNTLGASWEKKMLSFLDRQAAITKRECYESEAWRLGITRDAIECGETVGIFGREYVPADLADEQQVIKNAENYKLADDSKPQIIVTGEKHKSADKPDSREQLEDDALDLASRIWHRGCYYGEGNCDIKSAAWDENDVIAMLNRQAAITERELCGRCSPYATAKDYMDTIDSLTAERDELQAAIDAMGNGQFYAMYEELRGEVDNLRKRNDNQADTIGRLREKFDAALDDLARAVEDKRSHPF